MQLPKIPPEMIQEKLLFSAAPAAAAAAVVFAVGMLAVWLVFGRWRKTDWRKWVPVVAVLALAAGMLAVPSLNAWVQAEKQLAREANDSERVKAISRDYPFEETFPLVPDNKWWQWGLWALGLALVVEFAVRVPGVPLSTANLCRGVAAGVIAAIMLPPQWQNPVWQKDPNRWLLPVTAGVMAVQWAVLDAISRRNPGGTLAACLSVVAGGAACVAIHDGSARFTDFTTFVMAPLGVLAVGGWLTRSDTGSAAAVAVVPVLTVLLVVKDGVDPDATVKVPTAAYWLVALAPLLLSVFLILPVTRFGSKGYATPVKLLLVLVPVAIAVYLCLSEAPLQLDKESWE
ncbi:MAG: hypothetical protein MUF18_19320 [Fimbriiglobus sp.]|jgi:hypothetical protein|nr:hypothetical protein [Fimbriiglobus sp.]